MEENIPNQDIFDAFGVSGKLMHLPGGEGTCYRVNDVVLKPIKNNVEASWIAEINNTLVSEKFRVPKPIQAKNGAWVYNNWTASEFLEGEHRAGNYAESIEVSKVFHKAIANIPKPEWFDNKTDVFAISDKMAWGEMPIPDFKLSNDPLKKVFDIIRENSLPNQLIHGDWGTGQILFHDTFPPAVIDMTPYFRPANYPIADMMISAMADEGADNSIIDLGKDIKDLDQLLLRALIFRTCTYIGFQTHPENNFDWTSNIIKYLNLIDIVLKKIRTR